jgi:hypothetical protein
MRSTAHKALSRVSAMPTCQDDGLSDLDDLDLGALDGGGGGVSAAADPTGLVAAHTDPAAIQKKMKKLAGSDEQLLKYIPAIFAAGLNGKEAQVLSQRERERKREGECMCTAWMCVPMVARVLCQGDQPFAKGC